MNKESNFLKNTTIIVIGKICTQCISFFLLPLYTAVLSTEEYGVVDLLNTYITLLLPIFSIQMEQGFFRFLVDVRDDEEKKNNIFSTAFWGLTVSSLIGSLVLAGITLLFKLPYAVFLISNILVTCYSSNMLGASRGLGLYGIYSFGSFLIAGSTIVFNILFIVHFKLGATGMLLAYFCANLLGAIFCFFNLHGQSILSKGKFSLAVYKDILKYTAPLIPNTISWWLINASDRTIVSGFLGVAANGIYSVANKFSGVYITIYSLFNMTLTENVILYSKSDDDKKFLASIMNGYIRFFSCIGLGIVACMPFVFDFMVNDQFSDSYFQIPILIVASIFNVFVGLCTTIYVAQKASSAIAKFALISAVINVATNICMIHKIGLYAASISTCIAYICTTFMMIWDLRQANKMVKVDIKFLIRFAIVLLWTVIIYYWGTTILKVITLMVVCIFSLLSVKKYFSVALNIIRKKIKG